MHLPERREPPASIEALMKALQGLASNTRHRGLNSPEAMVAGAERMARMLLEFPGSIALRAINEWPKQDDGEWFPTEKGLRTLAEVLMRDDSVRKERADMARKTGQGRYASPLDRTEAYVEKVRRVKGSSFVDSWLVGGVNAQFTPDTVYLTGAGFDRLTAETWFLAEEAGVQLRPCVRVSELLDEYVKRRMSEPEPALRPKRRKGGWE